MICHAETFKWHVLTLLIKHFLWMGYHPCTICIISPYMPISKPTSKLLQMNAIGCASGSIFHQWIPVGARSLD